MIDPTMEDVQKLFRDYVRNCIGPSLEHQACPFRQLYLFSKTANGWRWFKGRIAADDSAVFILIEEPENTKGKDEQ